MKNAIVFIFLSVLSIQSYAEASYSKSIVQHMRLTDIATVIFERSFLEGCTKNQSEKFCKNNMLEIDNAKIEEIFIGSIEDHLTNEDLKPILDFFNTENGKNYNKIAYLQIISGKQWTPDMPVMTKQKMQEINNFRSTPEWKSFEAKMFIAQTEAGEKAQTYLLSKAATKYGKPVTGEKK